MKLGAMRDWLWPIFGAALLLGGAAVLAYKVINGYRHASPDAFFSVQDQNRLPAASTADRPTSPATVPAGIPAPQPVVAGVAQTPSMSATPPPASENSVESAPSAAPAAAIPIEGQDSSECAPIKSEQREVRVALNKQYSPEEGRYMQRRLRELSEQLVQLKCAE